MQYWESKSYDSTVTWHFAPAIRILAGILAAFLIACSVGVLVSAAISDDVVGGGIFALVLACLALLTWLAGVRPAASLTESDLITKNPFTIDSVALTDVLGCSPNYGGMVIYSSTGGVRRAWIFQSSSLSKLPGRTSRLAVSPVADMILNAAARARSERFGDRLFHLERSTGGVQLWRGKEIVPADHVRVSPEAMELWHEFNRSAFMFWSGRLRPLEPLANCLAADLGEPILADGALVAPRGAKQ